MAHHNAAFDLSRGHKQQQQPAGSCKAVHASKANRGGMDSWEIPVGHVVRNGHRVIAKPIRGVGQRDAELLQLAVDQYGFLLPIPRTVMTLAGFASLIEMHYATQQAQVIANTLHRLSA